MKVGYLHDTAESLNRLIFISFSNVNQQIAHSHSVNVCPWQIGGPAHILHTMSQETYPYSYPVQNNSHLAVKSEYDVLAVVHDGVLLNYLGWAVGLLHLVKESP